MLLLNGVPRSGKSSITRELLARNPTWDNLGVDSVIEKTPVAKRPGIGLRPGAERPDLEPTLLVDYQRLFDEVASLVKGGTTVVVDVGLHDDYSQPLDVFGVMTRCLASVPVLFVGVRCSIEQLRIRRKSTGYLSWSLGEPVPEPILRWERAVHADRSYDLEVDTSELSAERCADLILEHLAKPA